MTRRRRLSAVAFAFVLAAGRAYAGLPLVVDDDGLDCKGAAFRTIGAAIAAAEAGDEVLVCAGSYPEQVVLGKKLVLRGQQGAVIRPTTLPDVRPNATGSRMVAAAIVVDGGSAIIDGVTVDLSGNTVGGCSPLLAGIYFKNTSGIVTGSTITGLQVHGHPECDSGVGIDVETGPIGERFGRPILGRARVVLAENAISNFQKDGILASGPQSVVRVVDGEIAGLGSTAGAVQNGLDFNGGAKGKISGVHVHDVTSEVSGKTAAGVLLYEAGRVSVRTSLIEGAQTGIFIFGHGRVLASELRNLGTDGIVLLGDANLVTGTIVDGTSISGIFVNGFSNTVRSGLIANTAVGLWLYAGKGNGYQGINFENVGLHIAGDYHAQRDLTEAAAAPLL